MRSAQSELRCVYCQRRIQDDDDAQRIERRKLAHTTCAWAAEESYWNEQDEGSPE